MLHAGKKLSYEDTYPAVGMFNDLMDESGAYHDKGEEPWPSVGDFVRSQVHLAECCLQGGISIAPFDNKPLCVK